MFSTSGFVTYVSCSKITVARFFVARCCVTWISAFVIPSAFSCRCTSPRRMTTGVARPEKDACSGERCGRLAVEVICLLNAVSRGRDEDSDFLVQLLVDDRCYQQSNTNPALIDNESNLRSWMDLACL